MNLERSIQGHEKAHLKGLAPAGVLQRKCGCGRHTQVGEKCGVCGDKRLDQLLQAKLRIGKTNDRYEQEADRVAERVMQLPQPSDIDTNRVSPTAAIVQRNVSDTVNSSTEVPSSAHKATLSRGQPLDKASRDFMEPRFKHDFSDVRIHTDARSDAAARSVGARAYTLGSDIVFRSGEYNRSVSGRRLLAHELAHTIQQKHNIKRPVIQRDLSDDILDGVQVALDVGGLIPAFGIVPDLINAGVSGLRGDEVGAALSLAAAVPGAGLAVGAGKLGAKGIKVAGELAEAGAKKAAKEKALKEAAERAAKEKTSKEATERALKQKIAECEGIHAAYKSLGNCRACKGTDTKEERAAKILCATGALAGRRRYLRKRCDYALPGSIARGSANAERGHRQQVIQLAKMLANCAALPAT